MKPYTKLELQRQYVVDKEKPWFMPNDGKCINCHEDIPSQYTEKHCETKLITRCKKCGRSLL